MKVFIQIFIRTQADLPKEEGTYLCYIKDAEFNPCQLRAYSNDYHPQYGLNFWLKHIDWYLQEKELPTEEEKEIAAIEGMERSEGKIIMIADSPYPAAFMDGVNWLMSKLKT